MFLREHIVSINLREPVRIGTTGEVRVAFGLTPNLTIGYDTTPVCLAGSLPVNHLLHHIRCKNSLCISIASCLVEEVGKRIRVHLFGHIDRTSPTETVVVVYGSLAALAFFGGNQNDTERRTATIDRRSCGIFQYGNALDVLRIHQVQVAFHTVNQYKRTAT